MKYIILLLSVLFILASCNKDKDANNILYQGQKWNIVKINDTTLIIVPSYDSYKGDTPKVVKLTKQK